MKDEEVVDALSALAQISRLQVFRALVVAGPEGMTPGELVDTLDVPPATLSFHLKTLQHAGLIQQQRSSRNLIYSADFARMNDVLDFLTSHCCQGVSCMPNGAQRAMKCS